MFARRPQVVAANPSSSMKFTVYDGDHAVYSTSNETAARAIWQELVDKWYDLHGCCHCYRIESLPIAS